MEPKGKPDPEKRPEGAHENASAITKGRGSDRANQSEEERPDPETGEPKWKEDIKKQTGGG